MYLEDDDEDSEGFLTRWSADFYALPQMDDAGNWVAVPSEEEPEAGSFEAVVREGCRIKSAMAPAGGRTVFYGALVGPRDGQDVWLGFDDGELRLCPEEELREAFGEGRLSRATAEEGGIVNNTTGHDAAAMFILQNNHCKSKVVGLVVGKKEHSIAASSVYSMFFVRENLFTSEQKQKVRGRLSVQDRLGLYTFRRGDVVVYLQLEEGESCPEVAIYGVLYREPSGPRNHADKFLVLYEIGSTTFFLGKWPHWRRVPRDASAADAADFDCDDDESVKTMSQTQCSAMLSAWDGSTELDGIDSVQKAMRAAADPPPTLKIKRKEVIPRSRRRRSSVARSSKMRRRRRRSGVVARVQPSGVTAAAAERPSHARRATNSSHRTRRRRPSIIGSATLRLHRLHDSPMCCRRPCHRSCCSSDNSMGSSGRRT